MGNAGIPENGFKTVGQILATNALRFRLDQDAMAIALELVETHANGGPVLDGEGNLVGFVSEVDLLHAIEMGKNLEQLTAQDIMTADILAVEESTPIEDAVKLMEQKHLMNLPVKRDGVPAYSVTRHDLLRVWVGVGLGCEL